MVAAALAVLTIAVTTATTVPVSVSIAAVAAAVAARGGVVDVAVGGGPAAVILRACRFGGGLKERLYVYA
jgi:hypothetical protein